MERGPGPAATRTKRFAAKQAERGHAHEIGAPVDLGIAMTICGKHTGSAPEWHDHRVPRDARSSPPAGVDEWTTEH